MASSEVGARSGAEAAAAAGAVGDEARRSAGADDLSLARGARAVRVDPTLAGRRCADTHAGRAYFATVGGAAQAGAVATIVTTGARRPQPTLRHRALPVGRDARPTPRRLARVAVGHSVTSANGSVDVGASLRPTRADPRSIAALTRTILRATTLAIHGAARRPGVLAARVGAGVDAARVGAPVLAAGVTCSRVGATGVHAPGVHRAGVFEGTVARRVARTGVDHSRVRRTRVSKTRVSGTRVPRAVIVAARGGDQEKNGEKRSDTHGPSLFAKHSTVDGARRASARFGVW